MCRVGLNESCWECWAEHCQWTQIHNCQNVNETERLYRVYNAQGFPWLFYKTMFPTRTPKIEELVKHHA